MADVAERNWTILASQAFTSPADRVVQYQEATFFFKDTLLNAGWTVVRSSNAVSYGDADFWTTAANVVLGTFGNGSWIVLRSPVGWIPNNGTVELQIAVNATGGTPQALVLQFCTSGYHSGNLTTLPTPFGVENFQTNRNIIGWTTILTGRWTSWHTDRGDVMFGVKEEGDPTTNEFKSFFILTGNTDADGGGEGDQRWALFHRASSGVGGVFDGNTITGTSWLSVTPNGNLFPTTSGRSTQVSLSWTDGEDLGGALIHTEITLWQEGGINSRRLGTLIDVFSTSNNTPEDKVDDTEGAQDPRKLTIGEVWVYMNAADIPLT